MLPVRPLLGGLRALFRPAAADRDVDDEVRHYFDETVAAHLARGLSADQAAREARREMGHTSSAVREQVVTYGWETSVSSLARDVRQARRRAALLLRDRQHAPSMAPRARGRQAQDSPTPARLTEGEK